MNICKNNKKKKQQQKKKNNNKKQTIYGEVQVGKRSHGGQRKATLKASLKDLNIPTESWEQIAQDRRKWRGLIRRGRGEYEEKKNQRSQAETCAAESQS